jgi:hypothetical protein
VSGAAVPSKERASGISLIRLIPALGIAQIISWR